MSTPVKTIAILVAKHGMAEELRVLWQTAVEARVRERELCRPARAKSGVVLPITPRC